MTRQILATGNDCFISPIPFCHGCWPCVCTLWSMCVCVCSQLCWHFLKRGWHFRGFEDLIPSVFEELWAALLTALREMLKWSRQCASCLQAFGLLHLERPILVHPKYDQEKTCTMHGMPFRDDRFTAWSLSSSCFPLSCGVFLLFSTEAEKLSLKEMREESREWCGRENIENVWEGEGEICFSCYRLVSGANWHRLTSFFYEDQLKRALLLCPFLSPTFPFFTLSAVHLPPLLLLSTRRLPCLAFSAWMNCAVVLS